VTHATEDFEPLLGMTRQHRRMRPAVVHLKRRGLGRQLLLPPRLDLSGERALKFARTPVTSARHLRLCSLLLLSDSRRAQATRDPGGCRLAVFDEMSIRHPISHPPPVSPISPNWHLPELTPC
jgi:hypothetical protein